MFIDLAFRLLYLLLFGVGVILIRALLAEIDRQLRPKKGPMGFQVPPPPKKSTTAKPQSRLNQPPTTGYKPRNKPPATTKPAVTVYTAKKTQTAQPPKPALPPAPPPPASPPAPAAGSAAGSTVPDIYKPKSKSKSKSKKSKTPPKTLPPEAARTNIPDALPLLSENPPAPKPRDLFVNDRTRRKLMSLVRDRATAERLLKLAREYNPKRSEQWCYEKVIYDIERDRRA
jgi:hypothetical protein